MKKIVVFISLLTFLFSQSLFSQQSPKVSGTLYFTDGTSIDFQDLAYISHIIQGSPNYSNGLTVFYENSYRAIPYTKLKKITVIDYEIWYQGGGFINVRATCEIATTTGIAISNHFDNLVSVGVKILDKLTGEIKEQRYEFKKPAQNPPYNFALNIREISFNN